MSLRGGAQAIFAQPCIAPAQPGFRRRGHHAPRIPAHLRCRALARCDRRSHTHARARLRAGAHRRKRLAARSFAAHRAFRRRTRAGTAGQAAQGGRRGRADGRIQPLEPRRRGAHVPGRGTAAHPRRRHARRPHPRQARAWPVARAPGPQPFALRECRRLGPARHRQARRARRGKDAVFRPHAHARARRRAAGAQGAGPGHAPAGRDLRHRPHDRRSTRARAAARKAGLSLLLRHAGRSGDDGRRRGALPGRLRARHPRHRPARCRARRGGRQRHLGETECPASALPLVSARARAHRAAAAPAATVPARQALRHRPQHRRRGSRPARALARPARCCARRP
jgi:hypothetical protein